VDGFCVGLADCMTSRGCVHQQIKAPSHLNDGDMQRLKRAVDNARQVPGCSLELIDEGDKLWKRLDCQVQLEDVVAACESSLKRVYGAMMEFGQQDPTTLPWLPGREPKKSRSPSKRKASASRYIPIKCCDIAAC
jgi:hypothetical protein